MRFLNPNRLKWVSLRLPVIAAACLVCSAQAPPRAAPASEGSGADQGAATLARAFWNGTEPSSYGEPSVTVRIYDYAQVTPDTLAQSERVTGVILRAAGVEVAWADCSVSMPEPLKDAECRQPRGRTDIELRICSYRMARRTNLGPQSFGYAMVNPEGFSKVAAVFYHRVLEMEKATIARRFLILGHIRRRIPGVLANRRKLEACAMSYDFG